MAQNGGKVLPGISGVSVLTDQKLDWHLIAAKLISDSKT